MNHIDKLGAPYPPLSKRETQIDIDTEQNGWLGGIPKRWVLKKAKYLFCQRFEKGNSKNLELLTPSQHFGVIPQTMLEELTTQVVVKIGEKVDLRSFKGIHPGDFCISLRSFQGGFEYCKYEGVVSSAYTVFYPIVPIVDDYYRFLFKSKSFIERMNAYTMSLRDGKNIPFEDFAETFIPYPPLDEQKKIAWFLDEKCAEIDALMARISEEIDLLKRQRGAIIHDVVNHGVNPDSKLIDSGIEWIGVIPKHWQINRLGTLYRLRNTKVSDRDYPPLSVTNKGIVPQLETAAKTDAHDDRKLVCAGDFAINSRSDRRGSCGISPCDGSISLINTVLSPLSNMNPGYYNWLFHTVGFADEFYRWGHGIVDDLWTTGWQEMKNISIPVPPLDEQEEIARFLDKKCAEIDEIIKEKNSQLEVLDAYKKSLIYEYVTGKKEVAQ